jgi:hypothetical protein
MRKIKQTIYNFNELEEEVKKRLIEKRKEEEKQFYYEWGLLEDMQEEAKRLLEKYFKNAELKDVYYSLNYCQGDGAMIAFIINIADLNKKYKILSKEELRFIQDKGVINNIKILHGDNYYYHEYTFRFDYHDNFGYWDFEDIKEDYKIKEEDFNSIESRITELLDDINKHNTKSPFVRDIISMNKDFTATGYRFIEEEPEEAYIIEQLQENEYFKNGEIY